jgi:urea carboxylase
MARRNTSPKTIGTFFATEWEVHFNSSRTGVRLIGPKPEWVRDDGGEAGLHPSNIHDNPYAIGAVDFTGDMPVILGPDGPSLGGFVCPVTVIEADLWQLGQLKAGDKVRLCRWISKPPATSAGDQCGSGRQQPHRPDDPSLASRSQGCVACGAGHRQDDTRLVARLSGDTHLLLEIGAPELDLVLRFRAHALMQALESKRLHGVIDLTPGIRSLQVHYQPEQLPLADLLASSPANGRRVRGKDLQVPSRIVHLPLSWDDPACQKAIEKYMTTVRKDAPWCPSNLEFIRRINDLRTSTRCTHGVRRQLSGDGPGRCLPRRAGGHAARPAPSPGDHQVQPGAYLDGGKLGGHRRRLPVRVRHGRARRISVRRPHAADVESLSRGRRVRRQALAAALLRPDPFLPGERR